MLSLYIILLYVSIVEKSWMEGGSIYYVEASVMVSTRSITTKTQPVVEMVGPKDFVALGGNDLRIRYRLSSTQVFLETTPPVALATAFSSSSSSSSREDLSIQLTLLGDDGDESWIATQKILGPLKSYWQEVQFECGLIVRGGYYNIRLIEGSGPENDYDYRTRTVDIISNLTIQIVYPTIDFEVPHRLETYTTSVPVSFGFTKSLCKPKLPLPPTRLTLTICKQPDGKECFRDFATILEEPYLRLEREGRVTVMINCHLWARNSTYRVRIQEKPSIRNVIAMSHSIKVEWSPTFAINFNNRESIIPCRSSVQAVVSYPPCILPGKDKIRVYGYESLPVPSFLAPKRFNYISEKQILPNQQRITFPCNMFPQRFSRYCFQYINTAEDDSVAIVVENCIPTFTLDTFSDGGWGSWSFWSLCSATCGIEGKRFRYRFCDSPSPSFGANVCQGNFIEEEPCDKLPDCPIEQSISMSGIVASSSNRDDEEEQQKDNKIKITTRLQFLNGNVRSTPGCECGCLLYDLVPGFNYSLSVALSSNQSSCADEDEEEHHNLKWVLHASGDENRIRFIIVAADVQCVTLSFRDGNTTDSNLLEMITMSTQYTFRTEDEKKRRIGGRNEMNVVHSVESTGASLSIAAAESSQNCSSPFVYFIASYHIVPGSNTPQEYPKASLFEWNSYEFWTFIFLKLCLTFFILIVLCSTFGGCATKVYRKYKYKELKWRDGDEDEIMESGRPSYNQHLDNICLAGNMNDTTTTSRNTSITLMSFDYAYWKQMQTLRLKYFLLRPRVINLSTTKVRSFPASPSSSKVQNMKAHCIKNPLCNSKSESHLNLIPLLQNTDKKVNEKNPKTIIGRGLSNCECIYRKVNDSVIIERDKPIQKTYKYTNTTNKSFTSHSNDKYRKEKENLLKRKESEKRKKRRERNGADTEKGGMRSNGESGSEMSQSSDGMIEKGQKELAKSQISLATIQCLTRLSNNSSPFDGERDDFDGDLDFEMDYYDYNVLNAGNIPGSFLGLEPAFVLWNSEMYPNPDDNPPFPDESESIEMEMTSASTSASMAGLLYPLQTRKYNTRLTTRETSLDTLKFVDEEDADYEDDDAATHVSDSIFDNENDNDPYSNHAMLHTN